MTLDCALVSKVTFLFKTGKKIQQRSDWIGNDEVQQKNLRSSFHVVAESVP